MSNNLFFFDLESKEFKDFEKHFSNFFDYEEAGIIIGMQDETLLVSGL
jgi:hypothetical protein